MIRASARPRLTLRPYQEEAVAAVLREWESGHRSTLLAMATGSGKTDVSLAVLVRELSAGDYEDEAAGDALSARNALALVVRTWRAHAEGGPTLASTASIRQVRALAEAIRRNHGPSPRNWRAPMKVPRRVNGCYRIAGRAYPSVTTILQTVAKPALVTWAARRVADAIFAEEEHPTWAFADSVILQARNDASRRGEQVHLWIKRLHRGTPRDIRPLSMPYRGYARAFLAWRAQARYRVLAAEAVVWSPRHGYAGTCDLLARFADGVVRLVDFKTSPQVYPEHTLQVEAYRRAERLYPRRRMPAVRGTVIVLLRDDGTFEAHPVQGDFAVFLAVKAVWAWWRTSHQNGGEP